MESSSTTTEPSSQETTPRTEPEDLENPEKDLVIKPTNLETTSKNLLNSSTASLNIEAKTNERHILSTKQSKSAENILTLDETTSSTQTDFDAQKILNAYTDNKTKATATQRIPENVVLKTKETPDLNYIVKNVHGIFSSVSGSLMNAYNQKSIKTITKPKLPDSKIINEIFEDNEETVSQKSDQVETENDVQKVHLESLEKMSVEQRRENNILKEKVRQLVDELEKKDYVVKDVENKMEQLRKRTELAEKEKDTIVMRYAKRECLIIEGQRQAEAAQKAEKAALTEIELLNGKIKSAHAEKQRICQLYDDKCHELSNSEKELSKVREDIKELEGRLKWTQSKFRMEMDAYKESADRVEKLTQRISELETERDNAVANVVENQKAKQLEMDLKQTQAEMILCRHERDDFEKRFNSLSLSLEECVRERDELRLANEKCEKELSSLRIINNNLEQEAAELASLRSKAAMADTMQIELLRERDKTNDLEKSLLVAQEQVLSSNDREAKALNELKTLTLNFTNGVIHDRNMEVQALSVDNVALRDNISKLELEIEQLKTNIQNEISKRSKETRVLAKKVAELTEELTEANKKLEWEKGENNVLKRKHSIATKELNRELQRALKRVEQLEAKIPQDDESRTGSVSSLSSSENQNLCEEVLQNGVCNSDSSYIQPEPDKQALIERIVRLQSSLARRVERCEFLEEHCRQLTGECKNKSRVLRQMMLSSRVEVDRDGHKQEIARLGGGAMAAVWGGDTSGITLDISLEMNKKLQAVLEDALLKNIMLKENVDTLGKEIARLKSTN